MAVELPRDPCEGINEHAAEEAADLMGIHGEDRVRLVKFGQDVPYWVTRLMDMAFAVRRHPIGRQIVKRLMDQGDRARQLNDHFGKLWDKRTEALTAAQKDEFHALLLDTEQGVTAPTYRQLVDRGVSKPVRDHFQLHQRLMHRALNLLNIVRKHQGLEPIKGIPGVYFPHEMNGNFHLRVNHKRYFGMRGSGWDTQSGALRAAFDHLNLHPSDDVEVIADYTRKLQHMIMEDPSDYASINEALAKVAKGSSLSIDEVHEMHRRGDSPSGFKTHMMARKGRIGYDQENVFKVISQYHRALSWWAPAEMARADINRFMEGQVSKEYEPFLFKAINRYMAQVYGHPGMTEAAIDQFLTRTMESPAMRMIGKAVMPYENVPLVGAVARKLNPNNFNPTRPTARASAGLRGVTSDMKLGLMNYGVFMTHMAHLPTNVWPTLGTRYTLTGIRDIFSHDPEVVRAYNWGLKHGVFRAQLLDDAPGGPLSKLLNRATKGLPDAAREAIMTIYRPIGLSERWIREIGFFGAVRALREKGLTGERLMRLASDDTERGIPALHDFTERQILEHAKRVNEIMSFRYDRASRPWWTTGAIGGQVGQFKTFITGTIGLEKRLWDLGGRNKVRAMAPLGVMMTLGGIAGGFPFAHMLDDLTRMVTSGMNPQGTGGFSPLDATYMQLRHDVGGDAAEAIYRGIPALAGMDVTRRIGFSHLHLETPRDLLGPTTATILDTITYLFLHDVEHAGMIVPGISNLLTAHQWAQEEMAKDPYHRDRLRFTPEENDWAKRAAGVEPLKQAQTTDILRIAGREEAAFKQTQANYVDKLVGAIKAKDTDAYVRIKQQAAQAGFEITEKQVQRELGQKGKPALLRRMESLPKALRPEFTKDFGPDVNAEMERERKARAARALDTIEESPAQPSPAPVRKPAAVSQAPGDYSAHITSAAHRTGVSEGLLRFVMGAETGGKPGQVSRKGAAGLMQLMPDQFAHYRPAVERALGRPVTISDPEANILAGAMHLRDDLLATNGDVEAALRRYNAGPSPQRQQSGETNAYIDRARRALAQIEGQ